MKWAYNRKKLGRILTKLNEEDRVCVEKAIRKLIKIAERDFLITEIFNRRKFESDLEYGLLESDKKNQNATLIMVDIDGFKSYNDTYGHRQGDSLLKRIVKPLRTDERNIYRYGGEEFAIFLLNTDVTVGTKVGLRLRESVESYFRESDGITISVGVANYQPQEGNDLEQKTDILVRQADKALYHAKHSGKNRVKTYTPRLGPV